MLNDNLFFVMDTVKTGLEQFFSAKQKLMFTYKIKEKIINEKPKLTLKSLMKMLK